VRLVLDRNDAVSSRDSGTFRRKVQDAANTVNDIVTTIIVTIVTVVLGRAGGRLIPGRGPVTPPRETLLDVPPGQGEEVPPPPEQQGEEQQGGLQGPVARSLEPGTDFVDGAGRAWSFKGTGPAEPVADIVDRIATESRAGRNVLGDLRGLNAADRAAVEAGVRQDLQG